MGALFPVFYLVFSHAVYSFLRPHPHTYKEKKGIDNTFHIRLHRSILILLSLFQQLQGIFNTVYSAFRIPDCLFSFTLCGKTVNCFPAILHHSTYDSPARTQIRVPKRLYQFISDAVSLYLSGRKMFNLSSGKRAPAFLGYNNLFSVKSFREYFIHHCFCLFIRCCPAISHENFNYKGFVFFQECLQGPFHP